LLDQFGSTPSPWLKGYVDCALPGTRILPGLSDFKKQIGPNADLTVAPECLTATYRVHNHPPLLTRLSDRLQDRRADRNFDDLSGALARLLGPGEDAGTSNAHSRQWVFGRAEVRTYAFPPHLNRTHSPNRRHAADPGSETEASVSIHPGWLPPLTAQERGWLQAFDVIAASAHWSYPSADPYVFLRSRRSEPWHFWPADIGPCPTAAIGLSRDGEGIVQTNPLGLVHVMPRAWLTRVEYLTLTPAKGSGAQNIALWHLKGGQHGLPERCFTVQSCGYADESLGPQAAALAQGLSLPLQETRCPDV
jgi:hypothetical protein